MLFIFLSDYSCSSDYRLGIPEFFTWLIFSLKASFFCWHILASSGYLTCRRKKRLESKPMPKTNRAMTLYSFSLSAMKKKMNNPKVSTTRLARKVKVFR
jgi:hypothetical protein